MAINCKEVYEYNLIYFGLEKQKIIDNLFEELSNINFDIIKESYNHKIVPAINEDIQEKNESIQSKFLVVTYSDFIVIYYILLVNHVQKLYRMPIKLIKLKFIKQELPQNVHTLNYNIQDITILDQDIFLETLVETNTSTDILSSLLFMKTLNSELIDYKIRQNIIPEFREEKLSKLLTYENIKCNSKNDILSQLENI